MNRGVCDETINRENLDSVTRIDVGDMVQCFVSSAGEMVPMHKGEVVEVRSGYYMVDRMGIHGGKPWICAERFVKVIDSS